MPKTLPTTRPRRGRITQRVARPVQYTLAALLGAAAIVIGFASPAAAIDDIVLPVTTVTYGAEGEVIEVASIAVDPELVGLPCEAQLIDVNNQSVHPNNDLIITSGDWTDTVFDFEGEADSTQVIDEQMVLGETVVVELRLGPDGVSSGGVTLAFGCEPPAPEPPCVDDEGNEVTPNEDGTCPAPPAACVDDEGNEVTPNEDGSCPTPDPEQPPIPGTPPCADPDGNPVEPDENGECPPPPPAGPIDCGTDPDGTPIEPDEDGSCPAPEEGPPPLQPAPEPDPDTQLPVTGVESSLLLALSGLFVLAAGWALVLRPRAPRFTDDEGASSLR